jgi:hypothetical protein
MDRQRNDEAGSLKLSMTRPVRSPQSMPTATRSEIQPDRRAEVFHGHTRKHTENTPIAPMERLIPPVTCSMPCAGHENRQPRGAQQVKLIVLGKKRIGRSEKNEERELRFQRRC